MAINIKPNDYKEPVINEENVQMICDAWLSGDSFTPYGMCATHLIEHNNPHSTRLFGFHMNHFHQWDDASYTKITAHEVKMAFNELRKAGYHMMKINRKHTSYKCQKSPYTEYKDTHEVFEYNDMW